MLKSINVRIISPTHSSRALLDEAKLNCCVFVIEIGLEKSHPKRIAIDIFYTNFSIHFSACSTILNKFSAEILTSQAPVSDAVG